MVIGRARKLPDPRQPQELPQQSIARHLRPQHQKRWNARRKHAVVMDVQSTRGLIVIKPQLTPRIDVQVIKSDRQACFAGISRIIPDFGTADRAFGIVENRCDRFFIHLFSLAPHSPEAIAHLVAGQNGTPPPIIPANWRGPSRRRQQGPYGRYWVAMCRPRARKANVARCNRSSMRATQAVLFND